MTTFCPKQHTLVFLIAFLFPVLLWAQISEFIPDLKETDSTLIAQEKPAPIPLVNIIREIDETRNDLKLINRKIDIPTSVSSIDSLSKEYFKFIKQESLKVDNFLNAHPNQDKINNLISKWQSYGNNIKAWQSTINDQEERNTRLIETIEEKDKIWELSYNNALELKAPREVTKNVKTTWDEVRKTKKTIDKNNTYYLGLETKVNSQLQLVNQVVEDLLELKNSEVYDLFYKGHEPLWKVKFNKEELKKTEKEEIESFHSNIYEFTKYLKTSSGKIFIFLIMTSLLALFFNHLKRGFIKYPHTERTSKLKKAKDIILNHSAICVIFLALVLARITFSNSAKLFYDALTLFTLIIAIPIIRPYMHKKFKNILYFVILFFILDSAKSYIWFNTVIYRFYILIESSIVIGILLYFTFPYLKTKKIITSGFGKLIMGLTPVIYILSIISILSNLFGYTNITDISLRISTHSGVITILFYSLLLITNGITIGLINQNFGVRQNYDEDLRFETEKKTLKFTKGIIFSLWILFFLKMIDVLHPLGNVLVDFITEPYEIGNMSFTFGEIFSFIFTLIFSYGLTKVITFLINDGDGVLRFLNLPKGIPAAISLVIRYFIMAFGIILALSALGIDLSKFNLMAGALGLGVGFGLQTVISNFVSGLILVFERPILPGDTVEVNNLLGTVNRIGIRSSNISTFDGAEVIVPNVNLISNDLINWTLSSNTKRVEVLIGTSYSSDPNVVLKLLTEIAQNNELVLPKPEPVALFNDFGDSSLNFRLLFWANYQFGLQAKSDVSIDIYNRFKEEGIEIPFPQRDLNIREIPNDLKYPSKKDLDEEFPAQPETPPKKAPLIEPVQTDIDSGNPEISEDITDEKQPD